ACHLRFRFGPKPLYVALVIREIEVTVDLVRRRSAIMAGFKALDPISPALFEKAVGEQGLNIIPPMFDELAVDLVVNSRRRLLCRRLAHLSLFSFAFRTALSKVLRVTTRATVPFGNRTEAIAGAEAGRLITMPTDLFAEVAKATHLPP